LSPLTSALSIRAAGGSVPWWVELSACVGRSFDSLETSGNNEVGAESGGVVQASGQQTCTSNESKIRNEMSSETITPAVDVVDLEDIRATLAGDDDAFRRLVERYQQPIADYLWRFTRDFGTWEELVHETFVEAFLSLASFRAEAPLLHWLKKIATRRGYKYWRTKSKQQVMAELPVHTADERRGVNPAERSAQEAAETLHALLAEMSDCDRLVITLLHLEEHSVAETAQITGWSTSLVKVQAHRARKRLEKLARKKGLAEVTR